MGTAAEPERRPRVKRGQRGSRQRSGEDHSAEADPVPAFGATGAERFGADEDEALGSFSDWIQ